MARQRRLSDLPDFLQNSPFLPFDASATSPSQNPKQAPKPRPTLAQILRSKHFRIVIIFLFIAGALYILPSKIRAYHPLTRLGLSGPKCYFSEPVALPQIPAYVDVDWKQFAHVQYATSTDYLCNSLMIFESLKRFGSIADRILLYPPSLLQGSGNDTNRQLLDLATQTYSVKLIPVEEQHKDNVDRIWASSYTKLLAFNQTQYRRLIHLDSDSFILKPIDGLFFLPPSPLTLPRAYWLPTPKLSSHIMVLQPSTAIFAQIQSAIEEAKRGTYDMEIINTLFGATCSLLPHQNYALLTGEFRSPDPKHEAFLEGGGLAEWDPGQVIDQAQVVHFSDYPLPKPWQEISPAEEEKVAPACEYGSEWESGSCRAREIVTDQFSLFHTASFALHWTGEAVSLLAFLQIFPP
jgi:hypothetical protein